MSGTARRRAMAAIVVGVIAWPIVHIGLVSHYRIDPWELFGWSMYAVPAARVQVGVKVERAGKTEAVFPLGMERERIRDFSRRRTALGSLAPTDDLAREILATDATIDAVVIIMREIRFDPQTAHIVAIESSTRTDRSLVTSP